MAHKIKLAINGYGRIGRNVLRALFASKLSSSFQLVAINDLGDIHTNAHLTRYDSVHGRFDKEVRVEGDNLVINGKKIKMLNERDPDNLPWDDLEIDVVLECTGLFATREKASIHLLSGSRKVLVSAPAGKDVKTIVYGVNQDALVQSDMIISNASCTTNCLAPVAKALNDAIGIEQGLMVTVHAYTNDQALTDSYHPDLHRARSATQSMIPTKTGAAAAVGLVLPELAGKLDGYAIRVPTINVSVIDLTFNAARDTSADEVNAIVKAASEKMPGILGYCQEPLVSIDFNHDPHSSTFDAGQTRVLDKMVKVVSWYDNEWGFSNRMIDTAYAMMTTKRREKI